MKRLTWALALAALLVAARARADSLAYEPGYWHLGETTNESVDAIWTPNGNLQTTEYEIECWEGIGFTGVRVYLSEWLEGTHHVVHGLRPNAYHSLRVRARDIHDERTEWLALDGFWTLPNLPGPLPLGPVTPTSVQASWTVNGNPPGTKYFVECWVGDGFGGDKVSDSRWVPDLTQHVFDLSGLVFSGPDRTLSFRARAENENFWATDWVDLGRAVLPLEAVAAPGAAPLGPLSPTSIQANWTANGNSDGTEYLAECWEGSDFGGAQAAASGWTAELRHDFGQLAIDATHAFRVKARRGGEESGWTELGAVATHAAPPGAAPFGPPILPVGLAAEWTANGNPSDTEYLAECWDTPGFDSVQVGGTGWRTGLSAEFTDLGYNLAYACRVRARNRDGVETAWTGLGTDATLAEMPIPGALGPITTHSIQANWNGGPNAPATEYLVECWLGPDFGGLKLADSGWQPAAVSHNFTGLDPNGEHSFRVQARNLGGVATGWAPLDAAFTYAEPPVPDAIGPVTETSLRALWGPGGNPPGTEFRARLWLGLFDHGNLLDATAWVPDAASHEFVGLQPNEQYQITAEARNGDGVETPRAEFPVVYTLARPPLVEPFGTVTATSVETRWGDHGNAPWTEYLVECWLGGDFTGVTIGDSGWIAAEAHEFVGLQVNTRYAFRVKARNLSGIETEWVTLGDATTFDTYVNPPGIAPFDPVLSTEIQANWMPNGNPAGTVYFAECWLGAGFGGPKIAESGWVESVAWDFTGLEPHTAYTCRVKARNIHGVESVWTVLGTVETMESGFFVWQRHSSQGIAHVDGAVALFTGGLAVTKNKTGIYPTVNFGYGAYAHYSGDHAWPNGGGDYFGLAATAEVYIPSPGEWTFGVNSDDGFRLWIDGEVAAEHPGERGELDTLTTLDFAALGWHTLRLVYFECKVSEEVELFAAPGAHSTWDAAAFDLVGNTDNGGLLARVWQPEWPIVPGTAPCAPVTAVSITANWTANGNGANTTYLAECWESPDFTGTKLGESGWTALLSFDFAGLTEMTEYAFRVKARSADGIESAWTDLGSATTLDTFVNPPGAEPFGPLMATSIQANWDPNGNGPGTDYFVECWEGAGFTGTQIGDSGWVSDLGHVFSGLGIDSEYAFRAKARSAAGIESGWTNLGSVRTINHTGFWVRDVQQSGHSLTWVTDAVKLFDGTWPITQAVDAIRDTVNVGSNGEWGDRYAGDYGFPLNAAYDDNDFATQFTAYVWIPEGGEWSFGVNSDDGMRLWIDGAVVADHPGVRSPGDTVRPTTLAGPAWHALRLVYYDHTHGQCVELFAAQGNHTAWNATDFRLVGDVHNGGLPAVAWDPSLPAPPGWQPLGPVTTTSVRANWLAAGNPDGTEYLVECWLGPGFAGVKLDESGWTLAVNYTFVTLLPDTQYAIRVKARHDAETESIWTELGTVATHADAPVAQPLGPVEPDSIQANWGVADNPPDTDYLVECWAGSGFGGTKLADSGWLDGGLSHTFGGLAIGATYAFRVQARNRGGVETAWTDLGSEATRESDDTWYVDDDAAPGGDGTNWATAFENPQDALAVARAGDQIWVAAGTYKPGAARADTFQLKQGVALYGGFIGTEAALGQRDWVANITVLSGDIGVQGDRSDNCFHVVAGADFATLDGFTVTAGQARDTETGDQNRGGGLICVGVSPTVRHCIFQANRATLGGALYHWDGAHATYIDCTFADNVGESSAGVAYTHGSSPTFTDCRFLRNEALAECGGCDYNLYTAHPTYTRCLFARNRAENYGGAVRNHETASPTFTGCVFHANRSDFQGGTLFNDHNAYPTLRDCIVWANSAPSVDTFFNHTGAGVTVTHSCVQGGHAGTGNINLDPAFVDPDADDYRLKSATGHWTEAGWVPDAETSACIDGGDPADDFTLEPSPNGARINMGVYGGTSRASLSVPDPAPPVVVAMAPAADAPLADSPTAVSVAFDEAMDAATVTASSFVLVGSGGTGLFDDGDDVPVDTSGVAMSTSSEAALDLAATPLPADIYRLTLVGTGQSPIRDANGNALDGEFGGSFPSGNGGAGGDFVAYIHVMVAGNHVPVIQPFDLVYRGQGELWKAYSYQVDADDADGDTLSYELTDAPAGMAIDPNGGLITWDAMPAHIGHHTFTVRVDDGRYGFATRTFDLRIFNVNKLVNPDFEVGSIAGWTEHGWGGGLQVHGVLGERVTLERTRWYCYQAGTGVNGYLEQTVTLVPGREHDLFLEIVSYSNGINADGGTITVKANGVQIGRYAFGGNSKTTIYRTIDTTFTPTQSENVFQVHISRGYGLGWGWSGTPINFLDNLHVCESQYYDDTYPVVADISPVPAGTIDTRIAQFVVAFNKPIDGATVTADSFQLIRSVDGTLGNGDDEAITPAAVTLDNPFQATLDLNGVDVPDDLYQVVLRGDGADAITDIEANALDGDYTGSLPSGDGTAGGDFVATFTYQCPVPSIAHDPTSLVFRGTEGGANPASDVVDITNMGHPDSLLEWTVTSDAVWLSVTPDSGIVGYGPFDTVQVDVDLAGLTAGVYAGNLTITGERAPNSPVTVPVTLYVAGAGGLTAHWKLDDGSGTTATDSSGLGNHATVEGAAWATGIDNGALDFDGDDDVVRCPHVAADGLTDLTVACWVRTTANRIQGILSGAHSGNDNQFLLALSDTVTVTVHVKGPSKQWVLPAPVADGTWHHLTVTRDGTTGAVTLYVDAVSRGTKTLDPGALIIDENGLVIGQEQDSVGGGFDPAQTLEGRLDDVRIYNRVLAAPEIGALLGPLPPEAQDDAYGVAQDGTLLKAAPVGVLANDSDVNGDPLTAILVDDVGHGTLTLSPDGGFTYVPAGGYAGPDSFTYKANDGALDSAEATVAIQVGASTLGLGAHWKLDDGSGAAAADSSPNGYHGTLINGPVWAAGVKGGALEFDGSDDRVGVPHEAANGLDDMTICIWFRTRKSGIQAFLSGANATRDNELLFDLLNATTVRIMWQAAERTWTVPATSDGRWHHLALTRAGATTVATLYFDGRSMGTNTTLANAVSIASGGLFIGQDQDSVGGGFDPSQSFQGTLDDVRIYDRVLSHADIMGVIGQSPPQAEDDSYLVATDSALTVPVAEGVLVNDSDPDGDRLFADPVGLPAHGSVTLAPDGSFQYTPEAGFSGEDTFTYTASDGVHDSEPATVRINVGDIVEGLVAHWKLDEGEGTTAHDSSGNNLHGTVHGAAWASGVLGGALDFDGTNDYVDFGDVLNGLAVPFSFTAWAYHTPTGTTGLFSLDDGSTYYGFWVHIHDDDSIHICYGDGSGDGGESRRTKISQDKVPHHRWTHVACIVRGATDMTITLNGVDAGGSYSGSGGAMTHSSAPARLGLRSRWGPYYQRGPVDDVRIYDRALTDAEVQAMVGEQPPWAGDDRYALQSGATLNVEAVSGVLANDTDVNGDPLTAVLVDDVEHGALALDPDGSFTYTPEPTYQGEDSFTYTANDGTVDSNVATVTLLIGDVVTGLVAHWKFDEGEGTTAYDSSGNNNHGTLTSGPVWTSGVTSGALQFDGSNDCVEIGASDVPVPWTAACILKRENSSAGAARLMDSSAGSLRLEQWPDINKVGFTRYGVQDYAYNYYAPVGEWIHMVYVADGAGTRLYVDGVQQGTNANTINCPMTRIGGTQYSLLGTVDDIRIYNRALTPEEIAILASLPPTAMPDVYSVAADGNLAVGAPGVLGNDDSATGSPLTAVRVADAAHGTLALAADGSFTYAPDSGYSGLDSFTYKATDGATDSNVATVTFVVYQPEANLIAHWTLDEGAGGTAYDWSGHDNHAALASGSVWASGIRDGALDFDGNDDHLVAPPSVANGLNDLTIALWVRTSKTGIQALVSGANASRDNELLFDLLNATTVRLIWQGTDYNWTVPSVADGYWHHLAVTRDGAAGQGTLYVDGTAQDTKTMSTAAIVVEGLIVAQDQDSVGGGFDPSQSLDGMLDDIRIYDRALTPTEIGGLVGNFPPDAADDAYAVRAGETLATTADPAAHGTFNGFSGGGTPYTLTKHKDGPGPSIVGGVARLTVGGTQSQINSMVFDRATVGAFQLATAEFDFRLHEPGGWGGDGLGVTLLDTATFGTTGAAPGFGSSSQNMHEPSYAASLGVGFDIYQNSGEVSDNHCSLHWDGAALAAVDLTPLGLTLQDSGWIHATITVDPVTGGAEVTVELRQGATTVTPFDGYFVAGLTPYEYRVGFGAYCGADTATADVDNVAVRSTTASMIPPGVLANDIDRNGDALTAYLVGGPAHGSLTAFNADGSFTYVPLAGFTGTDTFTYQAKDPSGEASNVATVAIEVQSLRVTALAPAPGGLVDSTPAAIVATFDRDVDPATISTSTFIVVRSGGDNVFGDGDDVAVPPAGVALTAPNEATFDLTGVQLPVDLYQVRLVGTGAAPIASADGIALDGDFSGALPSGDGTVGGDFVATFRVLALLFEDVTAAQFLSPGYGGLGNTFFDVDNDGDLDLGDTTAGYKGNRIYLNDGTGTFEQAPGNAGIPTDSEGHSVIPGDFDNDGDLDFAHGWYWAGGSKLFRNNGNATFTDVSSSSGVGNPGNIHGGAFGDVDNDGDLDLAFAVNGSNRLYINDGTGHFSNEAGSRGAAQGDYSTSVFFADYDNDGDIDIFHDKSTGNLLANDGTGRFTNVTAAANANPLGHTSGFYALGDIDNDGDLDAYKLGTGVLLNNGDGTFTDITASCGVTPSGGSGCNAMWADVDHNGYLDLSKDGELWLNQGNLTFINFAQSGLEVAASSQSVAFGDIDGDGDLDARTVNTLLVNLTNDSHWLIVEPVRPFGTPAFNAKVWVYRTGHLGDPLHLLGYREIIGGCVRLSGSLLYAHFGLPHDAVVDVQVRFLSGRTKNVRGVSRAQKIRVVEPESDLTIIHVDADATGANDGTSWTDAFADLQDGLAAAAEQGTEIWVAEGLYTPTAGADRTATFALVQGVAVYGGFAGTEDDREQRDPSAHVTVLSGDIGTQDDAADNVHHVVTAADGAVLDGFTVTGGNADGGGSEQHGGGLYCAGVAPTVVGCLFQGNAAAEHGGGIYVADASPLLTDCTFRGNAASSGGGLFLTGATCEATVRQCSFDQNSAGQGGGACNGVESRATFDACAFTQNHAAADGGAVLNIDGSAPAFTDCSFTENTAAESGGGIEHTHATLDLQRCTFTGNEAQTLQGGALHVEQSSATIEGCTFSSNTAGGNGGGASLADAAACGMSDCTFEGNTAEGAGGGVSAMQVTLDVDACTFSSNMAGASGGGMRVYESTLTADGCTWSGNSAGTEGGGLYLNHECAATVSHCLFVGNAAGQGGGLYNYWYCSPEVGNCTFTRNTATTSGGAIHNHKYCEPQVMNSILWGNTVGQADDEIANTVESTPTVAYCCIAGGHAGEGNFDADSLFVDPDGGDYHLKSRAGHWTEGGHVVDAIDSPCLDAGKPTDPVGDEPFPNGGRLNVGAYGGTDQASMTYGQTPAVASIEPASGPAHTRGIIAGSDFGDLPGRVVFTPDGGSGIDWAIGSWANGQIAFRVAEGSPVGAGQVRVLRADAYPSSPVAFEVTDPTVIHVDDDNASGIENGTETYPFDTVAEGLEAATAGDTVLVHEGTYAENLTMKSAVILSGEGAGVTVVQGAAGSPTLLLPSSVAYAAGTAVRELTLRGGSNALKVDAKANTTAYVALDGVTIADAASHGACFRATGGARTYGKIAATLTDCRVANAGEHGILAGAYGYISYCDVQLTLNGCELDSNVGAGIRVETQDNGKRVKVWLNDCEVHHNGGQGIRGHSDGDTINLYTNRCHVHDNGSDGAYLSSYWYAFLYHQSQDSLWVDNAGSGVRITCSTNDAITSTALTGDALSRNGGHGLYAHTPDGAREIPKATLKRCTLVGNGGHGLLAHVGGGFSRGYFTVRDCLVADNIGGGLRFETAGSWSGTKARLDATVNVSTIANNGPVGLSRNLWDTRVSVANSIITGHADDLVEMPADNVHYCDVGDGTHDGVNGNLAADPLFVDAAAGDYRLQTGSPCIDAGDPAFTPEAGETDLEGNARVLDGRVNMGAYEKPADTLPELAAIEPVPASITVENSTGGVVQVEVALTRFVTDLTAWQFRIDQAAGGPAVTAVEAGSWWDTNPPESFASAFTPSPGFWVVMGLMTDTSGKSGLGSLATLTLDCAGIAPGTYVLPITATELVRADFSLLDHTVTPLEVVVVDAEPPAPVPVVAFGEPDVGSSSVEFAPMRMAPLGDATLSAGKTTTTVAMYCSDLSDATPPVLYQFSRGADASGVVIRDWHEDRGCVDVGLTPNTLYTYRARAKDSTVEGNTTLWSASIATYTLPVAPDVSCDKSVGVTHRLGDTFTFTNEAGWGPGALDHCHYVWTDQPAHAFDGAEPSWAADALALVAATPGEWYLHLVSHSPEHDAGEAATVGPFAVGSAPAAAPTAFTHVASTPASITWAWTDNAATETGFRVDPPGGITAADAATWTETGLAANARYTRHVHALNAFGDSPASNDHTACTAIETPAGVAVGAVTATTAALSVSGSFTGLGTDASAVYVGEAGGHTEGIAEWLQTTADTATGLTPNTAYAFRAKARNADGDETPYCAAAAVRTLAVPPRAEPLTNILPTSIQANWNAGTPANPAGTAYRAECWQEATRVGDSGWITALSHTFAVGPSASYALRVKARNANGIETAWTDLGAAVTPPNPPGALTIDTQVMKDGALNLTAPGCRSVTLLSLDPNGNPPDTRYAIQMGSFWLRFADDGRGHTDAYADAPAPEWHTAGEWAGKRLRGLTPATAYAFSAKAKNALDAESALVAVGSCSTNKDGDVDRGNTVSIRDIIFIRNALVQGGQIGVHYSWATDVNDNLYRRTDVSDMVMTQRILLNPAP